jgi:hypothetical protein
LPVVYFFDYIGRGIYSRERTYTTPSAASDEMATTTSDVFRFYLNLLTGDFGLILAVLGIIGIAIGYYLFRDRNTPGSLQNFSNWLLPAVAYFTYLLVILLYQSGDILNAPMYNLETAGPGLMLPLELLMAIFIGIGISSAGSWLKKLNKPLIRPEITFYGLLVVIVVFNDAFNYEYGNKSHNTLAHEYCLNAMDSCPSDVPLVVAGDELYAFWYMHNVYTDPSTGKPGYRPDIKLTTWSGELESLSELADIDAAMTDAIVRVSAEYPGSEIDTTFFNSAFLTNPYLHSYKLARRGLLFAFVPEDRMDGLELVSEDLAAQTGIVAIQPDIPHQYGMGFWLSNVVTDSSGEPVRNKWLWPPEEDIQWRTGEMLLTYGTDAITREDYQEAMYYFSMMTIVEPENPQSKDSFDLAVRLEAESQKVK